MTTLGARGLDLLKEFEGCRLDAYRDQRDVLTIGYGHTGPEVVEGLVWTQAQADEALVRDTIFAANAASRLIDVVLTQNQFDSIVSLIYNIGAGAFAASTLLKYVNQKQFGPAADEFLKWDRCNGIPNPGLARRREAERTLFLSV